MKDSKIVFYTASKYANPWSENAPTISRKIFNSAVLSQLIRFEPNIRPVILESVKWNRKNKHYILKLKNNLFFSNRRKVTIEDLEFSLLRRFLSSKENTGPISSLHFKGSENILPGTQYKSGMIDGIQILNKNTLTIKPIVMNQSFLSALCHFQFSLVPQEELQEDLLTWKKWPIGIGPYKVIEEDLTHKSYTLELNDIKKFPNAPKLVVFGQTPYRTPDIALKDFRINDSEFYCLEKLKNPIGIKAIVFNFNSELGKDFEFRKAIEHAINRNEIAASSLVHVLPQNKIAKYHTRENWHCKKKDDLLDLKKFMQKYLHKKKILKIPYTPDIEYLGNEYRVVIQRQLNALGFSIEFEECHDIWNPFESSYLDAPFRLVGLSSESNCPLPIFSMFLEKSPLKHSQPKDQELESLIKKSLKCSNTEAQWEHIHLLNEYFTKKIYAIPLFEIPNIISYNPKKIKSLGKQSCTHSFLIEKIIVQNKLMH